MRRFTLPALLIVGAFLGTACEGPEVNQPLDVDPSFGKVDDACPALTEPIDGGFFANKAEVLAQIHVHIDLLFSDQKSVNSAHSHIDNVARKVCDGDFAAATKMAWSFLEQVEQQVAGDFTKLQPPTSAVASDLSTETFLLACDPSDPDGCIVIPEGAFWPTGGIGIVDPDEGGTVSTRNGEAAAAVDPGDFTSSRDPVFLVFWRTYDPEVGIPGYKAVPEGYQILSSDTPLEEGDGVLVQMCVLLTEEVVNSGILGRLQLGHDLGDGTVHLLERVTEGLTIDCTQAEDFYPDPPATATSWLGSVTRWASAAFQQAFSPSPLFADLIGGVGLGGRTKSFSPFAPVDPFGTLSVTIENGSSGPVSVTDGGDLTCEETAGTGAATCSMDYPVGGSVTLSASFGDETDIGGWAGCTDNGDGTCTVTVMPEGSSVVVTFDQAFGTLTVDVDNQSPGAVEVVDLSDPAFTCEAGAGTGRASCSREVAVGSTITLAANADPLAEFVGWSGDCDGTGECTVSMGPEGLTVSATFLPAFRTLSVTVENESTGPVQVSDGNGFVCTADAGTTNACSAEFRIGESMVLTADPGLLAEFSGWQGDCAGTDGCIFDLAIDGNSVSASFVPALRTVTVEINNQAPGAVQADDGAGFVCRAAGGPSTETCTAEFRIGSTVTLTASHDAFTDFAGWAGDCTATSDGACEILVDPDGAMASATFLPKKETLEIRVENRVPGSDEIQVLLGGTVVGSAAPDTGWQIFHQEFIPGRTVTLTAAAVGVTWMVDLWINGAEGQCAVHHQEMGETSTSCTFTMPYGPTWLEFRLTDGG